MALPFQPACLPLLLGALPHPSPGQALELTRRYAGALLSWPRLPQRAFGEQSLAQSAAGFPGLVVDQARSHVHVDRELAELALEELGLAYLENDLERGSLTAEDAAGLAELLRQADTLRGVLAVKGQLLGPVSMATQLTDEQLRPLVYDEILSEALAQHLYLRAAWLDHTLHKVADTVIVCLDEPFLDVVGMPFLPLDWDQARERLEMVLAGVTGCRAIFGGGAVDWAEVLQTSVELIIADVYSYGHALTAASAALPAFLDRGGHVGLGLVPHDEDALALVSADTLVRRARSLLRELETAGVEGQLLLRQAVVSTSGSLGQLSTTAAERALQLLGEVSQQLREQYRLT
ncbi:MAG: hypothetical protein RLZZ387_1464 [Chloroflexota bacterium]